MRPLLVYNGFSAGGSKVYGLTPFSYNQIGDIVGTAETVTNIGTAPRGKIVQLNDSIYVIHLNTIKKLNSNGTWSVIVTFPSPELSNPADSLSQMYLVVVDGIYYLAGWYTSSNTTAGAVSLQGFSYNITTGAVIFGSQTVMTAATAPATPKITSGIVYGDTIYVGLSPDNTNQYILTVNAITCTIAQNLLTGLNSSTHVPCIDLFVVNNELWLAISNGTGFLYKLVGGTFVAQVTVTGAVLNTSGNNKPCIFTDGTGNIYVLFMVNSSSVWNMYKITTGLAVTNITATTIPGFSSQDVDSRWFFFIDQHTNPAAPEYYLGFRGDHTTGQIAFYRWNGENSAITFVGSAGESYNMASISIPNFGGGECMYTLGEMHVQIEGSLTQSATPGNTTISYRIYESSSFPSGTLTQVKMFYNNGRREVASTPCRLTNPLYGQMADSYTVTNVPCGSGNLHTIEWRAAADNVQTGAGVLLIAQVSGIYSG